MGQSCSRHPRNGARTTAERRVPRSLAGLCAQWDNVRVRRRALGALPGAAILAGGCRAGERPAPAARPAVGTAVTPVQAPAATANAGGAHDAPAPAAAAPVAPVLAVGLRMLTFVDGRRAPALPSRRG